MSQWRKETTDTTHMSSYVLGPQHIRADMTESKRHKAALIPIKILLAVQPSQVVKKLKSAMLPTTVMAKHSNVHKEDTVRQNTKLEKLTIRWWITESLSFWYLPPYQQTALPPSATLWLILLARLRAKKTSSHNWMRTNATAPTRAMYIHTEKHAPQFKSLFYKSTATLVKLDRYLVPIWKWAIRSLGRQNTPTPIPINKRNFHNQAPLWNPALKPRLVLIPTVTSDMRKKNPDKAKAVR